MWTRSVCRAGVKCLRRGSMWLGNLEWSDARRIDEISSPKIVHVVLVKGYELCKPHNGMKPRLPAKVRVGQLLQMMQLHLVTSDVSIFHFILQYITWILYMTCDVAPYIPCTSHEFLHDLRRGPYKPYTSHESFTWPATWPQTCTDTWQHIKRPLMAVIYIYIFISFEKTPSQRC